MSTKGETEGNDNSRDHMGPLRILPTKPPKKRNRPNLSERRHFFFNIFSQENEKPLFHPYYSPCFYFIFIFSIHKRQTFPSTRSSRNLVLTSQAHQTQPHIITDICVHGAIHITHIVPAPRMSMTQKRGGRKKSLLKIMP
jgi:hypothetical protein